MAIDDNLKKFLGQGMVFPIELTPTGSVPIVTGVELIRSNIKAIVSWPKYTRFMLTEFGNQSNVIVEDPADNVSVQLIRAYTIEAISMWEKRVELKAVDVVHRDSTIFVGLKYKIRNTAIQDSFVFPFYKSPNF